MRRGLRAVLLGTAGFLLPPLSAQANLVIKPAVIRFQLTPKRTSGAFVVSNTTDEEKRYRAKAVHFIITAKGGLKTVPPEDHSLAEWIKFNPKEFVMPPKSSRVIRYSIIPKGKIKPQDYWCAIEFMPLQGAHYTTKDEHGKTLNIAILSAVLVPIYGMVEGTTYSGEFTDARIIEDRRGRRFVYTVKNTSGGIIRLKGTYEVKDASGKVVRSGPLKGMSVFPGIERTQRTPFPEDLQPGDYTIRIDLTSRDDYVNLKYSKSFAFHL